MLVIRIAGAEEVAQDFPDFCSFCGREGKDYLVTPWNHIVVCEQCRYTVCYYFQKAWDINQQSDWEGCNKQFVDVADCNRQATSS